MNTVAYNGQKLTDRLLQWRPSARSLHEDLQAEPPQSRSELAQRAHSARMEETASRRVEPLQPGSEIPQSAGLAMEETASCRVELPQSSSEILQSAGLAMEETASSRTNDSHEQTLSSCASPAAQASPQQRQYAIASSGTLAGGTAGCRADMGSTGKQCDCSGSRGSPVRKQHQPRRGKPAA